MHVFIDDSGDPGFKIDKGSSRYFVIALVIFKDSLEVEKTAVAIKDYRRGIGFPDHTEFKFHKSSDLVREKFLRTINPFSFSVRCLVVDKLLVKSDELKNNKDSFYSYAIKLVLQHSNDEILDAKIRIDGSGDRQFKRSFLAYLRKQLNSKNKKIVKDCKLVDSKENVMIQMADMIAGSIRRSHEDDKKNYTKYKTIISKHITDEWKFK